MHITPWLTTSKNKEIWIKTESENWKRLNSEWSKICSAPCNTKTRWLTSLPRRAKVWRRSCSRGWPTSMLPRPKETSTTTLLLWKSRVLPTINSPPPLQVQPTTERKIITLIVGRAPLRCTRTSQRPTRMRPAETCCWTMTVDIFWRTRRLAEANRDGSEAEDPSQTKWKMDSRFQLGSDLWSRSICRIRWFWFQIRAQYRTVRIRGQLTGVNLRFQCRIRGLAGSAKLKRSSKGLCHTTWESRWCV